MAAPLSYDDIYQENSRAALAEGPMCAALLEWARRTRDGVSEPDLRENRLRYAAEREAQRPQPEVQVERAGVANDYSRVNVSRGSGGRSRG